jgi:hypothetical protein
VKPAGWRALYEDSLDEFVEEATEYDIITATEFLATYVKAGEYLGIKKLRPALLQPEETEKWLEMILPEIDEMKEPKQNEESQGSQMSVSTTKSVSTKRHGVGDKVEQLRTAFKKMIEKDGYYCIPKLKDGYGKNKVMKVKLFDFFQSNQIPHDFYPSWSLLGSKAMSGWCKYAEHAFVTSSRDQDADVADLPSFVDNVSLNSASSCLSDEDG